MDIQYSKPSLSEFDVLMPGKEGQSNHSISGFAERIRELSSQLKNKTIDREALQQILVNIDPYFLVNFVSGILDYDDRRINSLNQIRYPNDTDSFPYQLSHGNTLNKLLKLNRESQLALDSAPVFMDLGCGAGFPSLLIHLATGWRALGVDIQSALVEQANEKAREFGLESHVSFNTADAAESDLSQANIFYFFNPFRGETMYQVFDKLVEISKSKQILICSAGFCSAQHRLDSEFQMIESGIYSSK